MFHVQLAKGKKGIDLQEGKAYNPSLSIIFTNVLDFRFDFFLSYETGIWNQDHAAGLEISDEERKRKNETAKGKGMSITLPLPTRKRRKRLSEAKVDILCWHFCVCSGLQKNNPTWINIFLSLENTNTHLRPQRNAFHYFNVDLSNHKSWRVLLFFNENLLYISSSCK